MANKTTNFGLTKPLPEEFYDVNVQNENMDIIDAELKTIPKRASDINAAPVGLVINGYSISEGENVESILNKIYENTGFYEIKHFELEVFGDAFSLPEGFWFLKVYNNSHQLLVTATTYDETTGAIFELCRVNNGSWQPWEWVNPPMKFGVEYRTTERFNGKAVYAVCFDFYNGIEASKQISIPVSKTPNIIDIGGMIETPILENEWHFEDVGNSTIVKVWVDTADFIPYIIVYNKTATTIKGHAIVKFYY